MLRSVPLTVVDSHPITHRNLDHTGKLNKQTNQFVRAVQMVLSGPQLTGIKNTCVSGLAEQHIHHDRLPNTPWPC